VLGIEFPIDWAAVGAFLSGMASVVTAAYFVSKMRKRYEAECEKRMQALREGIKIGRKDDT